MSASHSQNLLKLNFNGRSYNLSAVPYSLSWLLSSLPRSYDDCKFAFSKIQPDLLNSEYLEALEPGMAAAGCVIETSKNGRKYIFRLDKAPPYAVCSFKSDIVPVIDNNGMVVFTRSQMEKVKEYFDEVGGECSLQVQRSGQGFIDVDLRGNEYSLRYIEYGLTHFILAGFFRSLMAGILKAEVSRPTFKFTTDVLTLLDEGSLHWSDAAIAVRGSGCEIGMRLCNATMKDHSSDVFVYYDKSSGLWCIISS